MSVTGIHHVTAISGDPQRLLDFWGGVLGMRLVKRTVNFDDPYTYHLYFGDEAGRPGTIVTFFPWGAKATPGRQGTGQAAAFSLSIPAGSVGYWIERLLTHGVKYEPIARRFDEQVIALRDPDGLAVELVAHPRAAARPGSALGPVPAEHAVRGLHAVTLWVEEDVHTVSVLESVLGLRALGEDGGARRFAAGEGGPGDLVDVRAVAGFWKGRDGAGAVHHVAFRVPDDATELAVRARAVGHGLRATEALDRHYFRSVYFREPGGVLFELATDAPGFAVDEPDASLGEALMLPAWLEKDRARLEAFLPPLHRPGGDDRAARAAAFGPAPTPNDLP